MLAFFFAYANIFIEIVVVLEECEGEEWRFLETGMERPRFSDTRLRSFCQRPFASPLTTVLSSPINMCGRNAEV